MSQRLGSNISSPLFMIDPVPSRTQSNTSRSYDEQTLFIKGGDSSSNIFSDATSGISVDNSSNLDDDVLIVDGPNEPFQLHRQTLRDTLEELKPQAHTPIRQLNPHHTECFRNLVEALRLLYGSQALYDIVLVDIRAVFADVNNIKPGTVAAFFVGCFTADNYPGPMGCSPKCVSSLRPTEGTPGHEVCEDLVLIYVNGQFSSLNDKNSKLVRIYIADEKFSGFTESNISQLRESGVENASLTFGNPDGSYRDVTGAIPLANLPRENASTTTTTSSTSTSTNNGNGGTIALTVIIIVIIILLLLVLYRSYYR